MKQEEFARLVQQYERLVYTICYQFVKDPQLAEDLCQETFLSAYTHRMDCPPDYLKSAYRRRVSASGDDALDALARTGGDPPPEELAITRDEAARARAAILALKEPYHQAAVLFFLEEKEIGEIAAALRRPPKTVHTQIYRARMLLRDALKGETAHGAVL